MQFDDFELVKEFPTMLQGKYPLRLYRSRFMPSEADKPIERYRYHFGFPILFVEPFHHMLETTIFWGDAHWKEDGDFWVWHTFIVGKADEEPPYKDLNRELDARIRQFNDCLQWYHKVSRE